jgi:hypothetical protein
MMAKRMGEVWWRPPVDDKDAATATAMVMAVAAVVVKATAEGNG